MTPIVGDSWTALVAITTCNRDAYVRRCMPPLARALNADSRLSLVVSLDGDDVNTRALCEQWRVPLIYSERREGVGISKNRILETFPHFDYYFFLEDDAELLDGSVFAECVRISRASDTHHMSLFERAGIRRPISESNVLGHHMIHSLYGGADFNFFTRQGIDCVGGWHPLFARYRRWGHTEHSYRFPRAGLAPAPFNVPASLIEAFIWHAPPSVSSPHGIAIDEDQIALPERELMDQKLMCVPVETLGAYHSNDIPFRTHTALANTVSRWNRYPLLRRGERRRASSDYLLWRFETSSNPIVRLIALLGAAALDPTSMTLRHIVKLRILQGATITRRFLHVR